MLVFRCRILLVVDVPRSSTVAKQWDDDDDGVWRQFHKVRKEVRAT
jgi:hypothetical protein